MNVQGTGSTPQIAQLLMSAGTNRADLPPQLSEHGPPSRMTSITNDQGQSLVDLRDELQGAVQSALEEHDGSTDLRATIEGAITTTLEEHGFDPEEVKSAMQESGFDPGARSEARMAMLSGAGGAGFDPSAVLENGGTEEDLIQSFLEQFRAGAHLDVES